MAGFDEAAMERLAALTAKAKAGVKLTAAEALEVKELKLQKSMVAIAQERAQIAVARRKIEDREKYRLGGLALAAKLNGWSEDALKAGFEILAAMSEEEKSALAEGGRQLTNAVPNQPALQLRVSFTEAPDQAVITALKKRGFKWNGASWDGSGDLADVRGEAELAGGVVEVV